MPDLHPCIQSLLAAGKGILAADESGSTIKKRLDTISLPSTEENQRAYRDLLFTTPGLNEFISGVILFEETVYQKTGDGVVFGDFLTTKGIVPGIKVDKSTVDLARFPKEKVTEGLDGLPARLAEFRKRGMRFTKWRAVFSIGPALPSRTALKANADRLALFAVLSQEAGLVPIVEPEVLMNGDHTLARCEEVTEATLNCVFHSLFAYRVELEGMLLKTGMVVSGDKCPDQSGEQAVAEATLRCLRRTVPGAVPGIVFLSGGQSADVASQNLKAIATSKEILPWKVSFSFGRALQEKALATWKGNPANIPEAQRALYEAAERNGRALKP